MRIGRLLLYKEPQGHIAVDEIRKFFCKDICGSFEYSKESIHEDGFLGQNLFACPTWTKFVPKNEDNKRC